VEYRPSVVPVDPLGGDPRMDPRVTPAEAIVESEPEDFWTPGRRVAAGRRVVAGLAAAGRPQPTDPKLLLGGLPVPYDLLDGAGLDGRALWRRREQLNLEERWFGELPPDPEPADLWDPAELAYNADFTAAGAGLQLRRHDGGGLDWYSVDGTTPLPEPVPAPRPVSVLAGRATYPGAPEPRWWQIERAKVDIGGYPPDRSHFATTLLLDLVLSHSDDWFTFPVDARAGHVVTLEEVVVHDSFGDTWTLAPPADKWSLFAVAGLDQRSLVLWPTVATPLLGPPIDEVVLGADEDANVVWAVERRVTGREVPSTQQPAPLPPASMPAQAKPSFTYLPTSDVPPRWHPYLVGQVNGRRRFVQARAADLTGPTAILAPEPESDLLYTDPVTRSGTPVHQIEPAAVPIDGLVLERRAVLGRRTDGNPVLWTQRRRRPLLTPPGLRLRFDTLQPLVGAP
jgi:hypothetical protein